MVDRKKRRLGAAQLKINRTNDRFKPGTFFVSAIILREKRELTSKAASKNVLLDWSLVVKNKKASDDVSVTRYQQLQRDHHIARASYFRSGHHIFFR